MNHAQSVTHVFVALLLISAWSVIMQHMMCQIMSYMIMSNSQTLDAKVILTCLKQT